MKDSSVFTPSLCLAWRFALWLGNGDVRCRISWILYVIGGFIIKCAVRGFVFSVFVCPLDCGATVLVIESVVGVSRCLRAVSGARGYDVAGAGGAAG